MNETKNVRELLAVVVNNLVSDAYLDAEFMLSDILNCQSLLVYEVNNTIIRNDLDAEIHPY